MTEDPGIKLFGKKIVLTETPQIIDLPPISTAGGSDHSHGLQKVNREDEKKDQLKAKNNEEKSSPRALTESENPPKTPPIDDEKPPKDNTKNSQPKTPKKPDKILPCPRCNSMDTKFCYYNNYNVNQPRHFCKSCQRYWTAGGAMRNMPVGAGRRKTKNPASHCRFVTISQQTSQTPTPPIQPHADQVHNFPHKAIAFGAPKRPENEGDFSSSLNSQVSWSYNPWNSGIGYPTMPAYPSHYWNCIPWLQNTSTLGKHFRDGELIRASGFDEDQKKQKSSVLIPKTLRIDEPDEAAKSSIWATLGIKNEEVNRGLFKGFEAKGKETAKRLVLEVNPAALSRSLCFQERA